MIVYSWYATALLIGVCVYGTIDFEYIHVSPQNKDGDYLPFLELGSTTGVSSSFLPAALDDSSPAITVPGGFAFGGGLQSLLYVRTFTVMHSNAHDFQHVLIHILYCESACRHGCTVVVLHSPKFLRYNIRLREHLTERYFRQLENNS